MVVSKETLTDLKEKYEKAQKFIEEESRNDPATDPYRSHYAAKDLLIEMMENLKNFIQSESDEENLLTYKVILAFVYRDLGKLCVFVDEPFTGEKYLQNCLELIEEYKNRSEAIIPYLGALNELGILWSNRQSPDESKKFLTQAEEAYKHFKTLNTSPITLMDVFGTRDEIEKGKGSKEFEKLYTLTVFYMAQILGQLGEMELSAQYCHTTLRRQLEANDYEPIDWALNAATLSQYFLEPRRFTEARHHLAAATYILKEYETKMITPDMPEELQAATRENFNYRYASIARCWAKYGLAILSSSRERLLEDDNKSEDDENCKKLTEGVTTIKLDQKSPEILLIFPTLKTVVVPIESRVSDQFCLTFDDAKLIYHFVNMWLDKSKEYYTSETEATEYSKIIMDYADVYKYLAFFDDNPANQSKLHKRRADYIEGLLNILNKTYYLSICRECWYELGLTYGAMLNIKLDALSQLKIDESPTPHALHKINTLCDKAIKNLKEFIDSYKDKNGEIQENIAKEEMQIILQSYFHLGRFFYKIITGNKKMQLNNLQNSLKFYTKFIEECEKHNEASAEFKAEIGVCKEMVTLLPHKIEKIVKDIAEEAKTNGMEQK